MTFESGRVLEFSRTSYLACVTVLLSLAGCQSNGAGSTEPKNGLSVVVAGPAPLAHSADGALVVVDGDNGSTIRLARGALLTVVLGSTYWNITGSSDPSVLVAQGDAHFRSLRNDCVPGAGCGGVSQLFRAAAPGRVQISASRTVCGEALACSPDRQRFAVTVVVGD